MMRPLTVGFQGFWRGFEPRLFFLPFLQKAWGGTVQVATDNGQRTDVLVMSPDPNLTRKRLPSQLVRGLRRRMSIRRSYESAAVNLWYTGENIRPPVQSHFELSLSFDAHDLSYPNQYLPLALMSVDWYGTSSLYCSGPEVSRLGFSISPEHAVSARKTNTASRPKFACAFIGRPEPMRIHALKRLREIGDVDVFGSLTGKRVDSKQEVGPQYRFMLCFENDVYPGYVTEKAIEAWALGCVPLWRGLDLMGVLNSDAVLNFENYGSLDRFVQRVKQLEDDPKEINEIAAQPILNGRSILTMAEDRLSELLSESFKS